MAKEIKLIHTADWHLSEREAQQKKARRSLDQLLEYVTNNKVNGLLIAGDIWDRIQPFGNNSAIKIAYDYLSEFSKVFDFIFIIKGNSSHDAHQSIDLLNGFKENIFAYETSKVLSVSLDKLKVTDLNENLTPDNIDLIIHAISYPTKAQLLEGSSIDMQNDNFIYLFEELMDFHGSISERFPRVPNVTLFHGNITGAKLSSGQSLIGQDILIPSFILEKTKSHYYALGHIHLPQNITPKMRYSGSLYNKDFGEIEQKYFDLIEFDGIKVNATNIPFIQSRPMIIVEAEYRDGKFIYDNSIAKNAEIKFRYKVNESSKDLITMDELKKIKMELGEDVKFEADIIAQQRSSRSSKIMSAKSLLEELEEYAALLEEELTPSLKEKINQIELKTLKEYDLCA